MRPGCAEYTSGCYGGSSIDAWDPADGRTPQRTMSRTWRDGSGSNVAVRAIGRRRSDNSIRAYFDVRGPGVLVDPYTLDVGGPVNVTPDEGNTISIPVMNTGEATDTFSFTFTGLPAGWTASTVTKTLAAGAGDVANIVLTPDANAPESTFTINVRGQSNTDSSVSSTCSLQVRVVLHETTVTYTGATSRPWGEGAGFSATFTDADDGNAPIVGMSVVFRINGASDGPPVEPDVVASTTTGAGGIATGNPTLALHPGTYSLEVCGSRLASTRKVHRRRVHRAETSDDARLLGCLDGGVLRSRCASGDAARRDSSAPLARKLVSFTIGSQSASGTTDSTGLAQATIVLNQAAALTSVVSSFAGDDLYLPSTDSDPFTIDKEDLTLAYTGDTLVGLGTTPNLAAHATQEAEGCPATSRLRPCSSR